VEGNLSPRRVRVTELRRKRTSADPVKASLEPLQKFELWLLLAQEVEDVGVLDNVGIPIRRCMRLVSRILLI
jgi:hypothetical protein